MSPAQIDRCRGEGFVPLPKRIKEDATHAYYVCPFCEASDHYATVALGGLLDARPIHCHHSGRMAWVMFISPALIDEEAKFRRIVDRFKDLGRMPSEKAVKLWHSQGCPIELAFELADDFELFVRLVDEHNKKGNVRAKTI